MQERRRRKHLQETIHRIQRQGIVIARKRSAVMSIFFTDIPFLAIRVWIWALLGHFPGMGVKNGICIILNVMQFTLVRLASSKAVEDIECRLAEYQMKFCTALRGTSQEVASDCGRRHPVGRAPWEASPASRSPPEVGTPYSSPLVPGARIGQDSPFPGTATSGDDRQADTRAFEALRKVRNETVRSTSICVHFWAVTLAFGAGLLLAKGEYAMVSFAKWAEDLAFK